MLAFNNFRGVTQTMLPTPRINVDCGGQGCFSKLGTTSWPPVRCPSSVTSIVVDHCGDVGHCDNQVSSKQKYRRPELSAPVKSSARRSRRGLSATNHQTDGALRVRAVAPMCGRQKCRCAIPGMSLTAFRWPTLSEFSGNGESASIHLRGYEASDS